MNGGRRLVETLQRIGYGESHDLQAEDFDWMFDNEAVMPFLDWFCDNVGPSNCLSEQEINQFSQLESSGEGVLEGDQLDEALRNMPSLSGNEEEMTPDALRERILQMEDEISSAHLRKEHLLKLRNKLSMHHTGLTHKLTKLSLVESSNMKKYRKGLEQSQTDNTQINTALERLGQSAKDLVKLYNQPPVTPTPAVGGPPPDTPFLSQQSLGQYLRGEERFTQELTDFTKKQFFEGIAELVGHDEGSRYQLLNISDPRSLAIKGEKQHVTENDCKELARLQSLYPTSQQRRTGALVDEARLLAACRFAGEKLQSLDLQQGYPSSVNELSDRLKNVQTKLQASQRLGTKIGETDLRQLIQANAELQATRVLSGDYNLKIMRQDYLTTKQDQLIKQLTAQQSRHKFLLMSYEIEAHKHRATHRLMTAAQQLLERNLLSQEGRMHMMMDPSLSPPTGKRSTIDSRDLSVTRLHNIIVDDTGPGGQQQLFLTYSSLHDGAKQLVDRLVALRETLSSTNSSQDTRLADLEQTLKRCEDVVYAGSTTIDGQPILSPPQLVNGITRLHQTLQKLEQTIRDIIADYNGKLKFLKGEPLLARERQLFVYFYTDPPRLRRTVGDVTQRLEAQLVK